MRCWVKSRNERNPCPQLPASVGDSRETAGDKSEEGGDDVKSSCPSYVLGYTLVLHSPVQRAANPGGERIPKSRVGSDWRLKLASMKVELLVIADQQRRGEYVLARTHRPSHHESQQYPKPVA